MAELFVWMHGRRVGTLTDDDRGGVRFAYDPSYREDPSATPLSTSMPLGGGDCSSMVVEPYLWGLLPDNGEVINRWARTFGCSPSNVVALLTNVGADVAGAASYLPPGVRPDSAGSFTSLSDEDVAAILADLRVDGAAWHPARASGRWSLAGAQAKVALALDPKHGWAIPAGTAATTHMLKVAIRGFDDQDLDEVLCARAAANLGLTTAKVEIGHFGDERAIVAERYDRIVTTDGVRRIHQEDFCQALGVHPFRKYQSDGGPTPEDLFTLVRANSVDPAVDIGRLCDALAFNWLILGTDAHAKNYSLLLDADQVRLAPLYDLASIAPYSDRAGKEKLAQKIGGEYRAGQIRPRHWKRAAETAGIDAGDYLARIETLAADIPDAFTDAARALELTRSERRRAAGIIEGIVEWTTTCRALVATR